MQKITFIQVPCIFLRKSGYNSALFVIFSANLVVVHRVCTECLHLKVTEDSECATCGVNRHVFAGCDAVDEFCTFLFDRENIQSVVFAHNFKVGSLYRNFISYLISHYFYQLFSMS